MGRAESGGGSGVQAERRPVLYCLIPSDLAPSLHDLLRRHFRDDPTVEVIVERRGRDRRREADRRQASAAAPSVERRLIRGTGGRRVAERRASLIEVDAPELPRRARRHAARIVFVERLEPSTEALEDADTARVVTRFQAGDSDSFLTLYTRYFDRVYGYLRIVLRDPHESEDAAQEVFTQVLEALPGYERRRQPFRAWLFTVVRNHAVARLRKSRRVELIDPEEIGRMREPRSEKAEFPVLDWITDRDLLLFIERLPLPQRQVLVLRYVLDFDMTQIAAVLERSTEDVRILHHRAVRFLEDRLTALGRSPRRGERARLQRRRRQSGVLRLRRFALS